MKRCKIKFDNSSAGFSSDYLTIVSSVSLALSQGYLPYIDSSNTWFNPTYDFPSLSAQDMTINPWDWWFDQDIDGIDENTPSFWINRGVLGHSPFTFMDQPNIDLCIKIAKEHIKIKKPILDKVDEFYNKNLKGKTSLGIVARGTEMLNAHPEYPKISADQWPYKIEEYIKKHPVDVIFLGICDDNEILDSILSSFSNVVYLKDMFRQTTQSQQEISKVKWDEGGVWWLTPLEGSIQKHRKRLGEECLLATQLISRCDYFLGSHSGMSNLSQFFNNKEFKNSTIE